MSALGNAVMYCVPYGDDERNTVARKRLGRKELTPAERLHRAVVDRGRIISAAEHMHELALPDVDAVLALVLADPKLDVENAPRNGSKLIIPRKTAE